MPVQDHKVANSLITMGKLTLSDYWTSGVQLTKPYSLKPYSSCRTSKDGITYGISLDSTTPQVEQATTVNLLKQNC